MRQVTSGRDSFIRETVPSHQENSDAIVLQWTVKDTGIGITADQQSDYSEPMPKQRNRRPGDTGNGWA